MSLRAILNCFSQESNDAQILPQGNPRLKVGDVKEKDADTITAGIVTKDKEGLVQRFVVNRHNGFYRPEEQ